jgi:hypothetical protein
MGLFQDYGIILNAVEATRQLSRLGFKNLILKVVCVLF